MKTDTCLTRRKLMGFTTRQPCDDAGSPMIVRFLDRCLAMNSVSCRACEDHCDERAIRFLPRIGQCEVPALVPELCTGCGECQKTCPNNAIDLIALTETVSSSENKTLGS